MTHGRRRIIFWFFVVAFFAIAPLLIFFALGYRYSPQKNAVLKTGTLIASSLPRGANVMLDGKKLPGTTPLTYRAVPPGTYTITLQKDGYLSWQKKLTIESGMAAFAADITLFPDVEPALVGAPEPGIAQHIWFAPSGSTAIGVWAKPTGNELRFLSLETNPLAVTPLHLPEMIIGAEWNSTGSAALLSSAQTVYLFDTSTPPLRLRALPAAENGTYRWSSDGSILLITASVISLYQPATQRTTKLTSIGSPAHFIDAIRFADGSLATLTVDGSKVITLQLQTPNTQKQTATLGLSGSPRFVSLSNHLLIMTKTDAEVWSYKNGLTQTETFAKKLLTVKNNGQSFLYSTGNDIWLYDLASSNKELLLRTSGEITDLGFSNDDSYILYNTGALHLLERDGRDLRNDYIIVNSDLSPVRCVVTTSASRLYCTVPAVDGVSLLVRPL